jgi:hypothetical protein
MWPAQRFSYCHQPKARENFYMAVILVCYVLQECYLRAAYFSKLCFYASLSVAVVLHITGSMSVM